MDKVATFKERLLMMMEFHRMTMTELSDVSGIGKSVICYYTKGRNAPKHEYAERIARIFNVNINWLLGYDVPQDPDHVPTLIEKLDGLNEIGRKKAEEYIDDLLSSSRYKK